MKPFTQWTDTDVALFNSRTGKAHALHSEGDQAVSPELDLHNQIIEHCRSQWPRWKYIHANPVVKSTIQKGCQDFTIFAPGKVLCIECKAKGGKPDPDQLIWHKEMAMLGYTVQVVRSFEEFLKLL